MRSHLRHATAGLFLLLILPIISFCQTPVSIAPVARQVFFSQSGAPLAGGCVSTFQSGTSTPAVTYADAGGLFPLQNPIQLDAAGSAVIWLAAQSYKIVVSAAGPFGNCSPPGTPIYSVDNIQDIGLINGLNSLLLTGNQTAAGNKTFSGNVTVNGTFTTSSLANILIVGSATYPTIQAAETQCPLTGGCTIWVPSNTNPTLSSVLTISTPTKLVFMSPNNVTCTMTDPSTSSGCINAISDNVTLQCQDKGVVFTQPNAQNIETFMFMGAHKNITVQGCKFDWNDANQTNISGFYSVLRSAGGSADLRVYDNEFFRGGDRAIDFRGTNRSWIENNYFHQIGIGTAGQTTGGNSVSVDVDGTTQSTDCWIENNIVSVQGDALACAHAVGVHINHNTIYGAANSGGSPTATESGIDADSDVDSEVIGNHVINVRGPQLTLQSINVSGVNYVARNNRVEGNTFVANASSLATSDPRVIASIAGGGISSGQQTNIGFINNSFDGTRLAVDTVNNFQIKGNGFHNVLSSIVAGTAVIVDQVNGSGAITSNFNISGNTFTTDNASLITAIEFTAAVTAPDACVVEGNSTSSGVTNDIVENTGFGFNSCLIIRSNKSFGLYSNGGVVSPVMINSAGITDTSLVNYKRSRPGQGTALTTSMFALSTSPGWGSSPSVSSVSGEDSAFIAVIASGTGSPGANPTVTFTYADGTWNPGPACIPSRGDGGNPINVGWSTVSITSGAATFLFQGTPSASTSYILVVNCQGR